MILTYKRGIPKNFVQFKWEVNLQRDTLAKIIPVEISCRAKEVKLKAET